MPTETIVSFPSGDATLTLEGRLHVPEGTGPHPGVVVCHPYPPEGGSLLVKVVRAISRHLVDHGVIALRFNFRGVGRSEGTFDDGRGEVDDVRGALDALIARPECDPTRIGLAGYSFGSLMALRHEARVGEPHPLLLVGPPLHWEIALPDRRPRPWRIIVGDADEFCPLDELQTRMQALEGGAVTVIDGADHFFIGSEDRLADEASAFLVPALVR